MDLWVYWVCLGLILFIIEVFVMSFDFMALGIAALVTALLTKILGIPLSDWNQSGIIFLVASILTVIITRVLVLPKIQLTTGKNAMSSANILGKEFHVLELNGRKLIKYEGVLRNIKNNTGFNAGDLVKVLSMDDNKVVVEGV